MLEQTLIMQQQQKKEEKNDDLSKFSQFRMRGLFQTIEKDLQALNSAAPKTLATGQVRSQ